MSAPSGCFSSNPFDHLPSDILALVYQQLGLSDLSSLGRTSSANLELHETLSLPTYLNQAYSLHRQLSLSPPLPSWSPSATTQHLHLASQRLSRREFIARPLPLPPSTTKSKRVAALRPLLAVGRTRIVVGGVGGRRASLIVYDFEQRQDGEGKGEMAIGKGLEVGFEVGIGERDDSSGTRLGWVGREGRKEVEGESSSTRLGTGSLLSGDITGLEFDPTYESSGLEEVLLLTFANGVVQSIRLPSRLESSAASASPPSQLPRSKKNGRRPAQPTLTTSTPSLPLATLLDTYAHPPSPIQSLSIPSFSPSSSHHDHSSHLFLTSSYSSLLTLYTATSYPSTSTTLTLPKSLTPWSTLLLSSHPSPSLLVGTSTSLLYYDLPLSSPHRPRSLLPESNTSATYALHAHPFNPNLLLSAHSHPIASVLMHDLRLPSSSSSRGTEVGRCSDPWTEESWYSVGMTEEGRTVLGGTGGVGGRVGVWDVRMSGGKEGKGGGWTCFAPSVGEGEGGRGVSRSGGEVGKLVVKGGRVWGVTPSSPFLLDFSSTSNLSSLYPPLPSPQPPTLTGRDFGGGGEGVVSWYEHQGEKVVLGLSERVV